MAANRRVYCLYGKYVPITDTYHVDIKDPLLLLLEGTLDSYGRPSDSWGLYSSCPNSLNRDMIPKFSTKNLMNMTLCQNFPLALEGLTLTEECLIAKCHPLGVVLKPRPGGYASSVSYYSLPSHFIIIRQDPGPLLDILPSPELTLYSLIKVF